MGNKAEITNLIGRKGSKMTMQGVKGSPLRRYLVGVKRSADHH